jgi:hypothetical protein
MNMVPAQARSILIVEDERIVAKDLQLMLRDLAARGESPK